MSLLQLLVPLLSALLWLVPANADTSVAHPGFDFDSLGDRISLLGDFDGLSFYTSANASAFLSPPAANSSALYLRNTTSGSAVKFASVSGGPVTQLSQLSNDTVLVFGSFSAIDGKEYSPPVILNVTSGDISTLFAQNSKRDDDSVSGQVLTTFVDGDLVYLGGDFEFNNTYGAAIYNTTSKTLHSTPFLGFGENSSVNAISKYSSGSDDGSILFGGSFNTLGLPELLRHNISHLVPSKNDSNSTNTSLISAEQVVSLKHASFTSINGASGNDDDSVICPTSNNVWALQDNSGGQWAVQLPTEMRGLTPTKVRIYLPDSSNGIKSFRLYTYPNNGIMNLTYVDPNTNDLAYCDAECPLMQLSAMADIIDDNKEDADSYEEGDTVFINDDGSFAMYYADSTARNLGYGSNYQEFALVNSVMIQGLGLTTTSWYGSRGEFAGLELYSDNIAVYGNETLNESNCGSESQSDTNLAVQDSGTWQSVQSLDSSLTNTDYLVSVVDGSSSITLYPNISYSGFYSLLMYTPGCVADGSCAKRAKVNVTLYDTEDQYLASSVIYQNNNEQKFDYLFYGHLNGSSTTSGRNKVTISFDSAIDPSVESPWMVVDKVVANIVSLDNYFDKNSTNTTDMSNTTEYYTTSMSLNGLFEYSLANFSFFDPTLVYETEDNETTILESNTFVGNSTINVLSGNLTNSSSIDQILLTDNNGKLLLVGNFDSPNVTLSNNNLVTLSIKGYNTTSNDTEAALARRKMKREDQTILGATFNDSITSIANVDDGFVALGAFSIQSESGLDNLAGGTTNTANNVALYKDDKWHSFGNSYFDEDLSQFTSFQLNDVDYYIFSSANGAYHVWDNTNSKWGSDNVKLDITSAIDLESRDQQVIGGSSFGVMDFYGKDQAYFYNNTKFSASNLNITNGSVLTSFFVNSSYSVIGGNFAGEDFQGVVILSDNETVSLSGSPKWNNNSTITSLFVDNDSSYLFIGSNGSVAVGDDEVMGLSIYNLNDNSFSSNQPSDLSTTDGSGISINAMAYYDSASKLLVGGHFDYAGSLECGTVCVYDVVNTRWVNPSSGSSIGGNVTDAKFLDTDHVLLSGDLTFNDTSAKFVVYDFVSGTFAATDDSLNNLGSSGSVNRYILNDQPDGSLDTRMAAIGSDFVLGYNGSSWSRIDQQIEISDETRFDDLKLVQLSQKNSANSDETYFDDDMAMLLSGVFNLTDYGVVNVAIYDGSSWIPYIFSSKDSSYGVIYSMLFEEIYRFQSSSDTKKKDKHMSTGQVVGISLACALGSTALLGLLFIVPMFLLFKKGGKKSNTNQRIYEDEMMDHVNPQDLIHEMDAQRHY